MSTASKVIPAPTQADNSEKKRLRSPAYPFVNLETAIKRAKAFNDREPSSAAPVRVAVKHWGYEEKSSGGLQTIAALMSFGLMQDEGTGQKRKVRLTDMGRRIVLDTRLESTERDALIKRAALMPKIHAALWSKYRDTISDANLRHTLLFDWEPKFNEKTVDNFIREYRDTIKFAKLSSSDTVAPEVTDNGGEYVPKVGDYVQWESGGALQYAAPKRITEILNDDFVRVEDSVTGIPRAELILESVPPPAKPEGKAEWHRPPPKTHMQEMVVPLSSGSRAVFQWPRELKQEDVDDLKDSLEILKRKISRSTAPADKPDESK